MTKLLFTEQALDEYLSWQMQDRKTLKKINLLLKDISRNAFEGIGKPEPLKQDLAGFWSRRIDSTNRIVYKINGEFIEICQCKGHY